MGMSEDGYGCHKDISVLAVKEKAIIQKEDPLCRSTCTDLSSWHSEHTHLNFY